MLSDMPSPAITGNGRVVRVIDGDTVEIETTIRFRVRLLSCWAPESRTSDKAEKRRGLEAKAFLKCVLQEDSAVRWSIPFGPALQDSITLGRVLGRVWRLDPGGSDADVSEIMTEAGYASPKKEK
jgi:endonuclease YncB( thermonuclease family)